MNQCNSPHNRHRRKSQLSPNMLKKYLVRFDSSQTWKEKECPYWINIDKHCSNLSMANRLGGNLWLHSLYVCEQHKNVYY